MNKIRPEDFTLFSNVPDKYLFLDPELYILNASNAYLEATLTDREDIIGKHVFDVFPDNPELKNSNSVANLRASLDFVLHYKKPHHMPVQRYDIPIPAGGFDLKFWQPMNSPALDEKGNIHYIIHKVEDVTKQTVLSQLIRDKEQKEKHELISSIAQKKLIYDFSLNSPFVMGIFRGPEYIIETANPAMGAFWNKNPEEVFGVPLFEAFPKLKNQGFKELMDIVLKTGVPYIGKELPIAVGSGKEKKVNYYDLFFNPIAESDGRISGITFTATDVTSAVKANIEIRESKDRFQQLLESMPVITWMALPSGELFFFNHKWYEYTGLSYEDSKNWGWEKVLHPDDFQDTIKAYTEAIQSERDYEKELRLKSGKDGTYRWHLERAMPLKNTKGEITHWIGNITDIHDLKTAEVELKKLRNREKALLEESEMERKRLYNLFMDAPAMIASTKGPDHVYELTNPLYRKLYGDRQLVGKAIREAIPEFEGQGVFESLDRVYESGEPFIGREVPLQIGNENDPRYFNFIYKPTYDHQGHINGIIGFGYEVTDQVLGRKQLEESEQRLRIAQQAANIGTFEWDLSTNSIKFTPQVEIIFGFAPGTWQGNYSNALKTIHPDDKERIQRENQDAIKSKKNLNIEHRIIRPDGETRWLNSKGEIFSDENNVPVKVFGVIIDITERKEAEQALERKNKELLHMNTDLDNFIYTASHDLKAPISNLEGLLNAFTQEAALDKELKVLSDLMFKSIQRLSNTIKDLTEISKAQRGPEEDFDRVSFPAIWNEVKLDISDLIEQYQPEIKTEFQASEINYSRKNLRSILYNIVSNSIKYSSPKRKPLIKISSQQNDECIMLKVSDNGLGLSLEDQKKIFGMFKRAHQHVEGTGIGLYVIKRMVENSGGKIEVHSELDKGTTFIVQFREC